MNELLSKRLKLRMEELSLRQVDVLRLAAPYCEAYGVRLKKSDLSQYLSGRFAPKADKLRVLSLALGVSEGYLSGWEDAPHKKPTEEKTALHLREPEGMAVYPVPVYGEIPAGYPSFHEEAVLDYRFTCRPNPAEYFALKVKGDSMIERGIYDGSVVLVHRQSTAENGQVVACRLNGDETTLKTFHQGKDEVILLPANSAYSPITVPMRQFRSGEATICGVVKEIITEI